MSDINWDETFGEEAEELNDYNSLDLEEVIENGLSDLHYSMVENPKMSVSMSAQGGYRYQLPDQTGFTLSIPVGMASSAPVTFIPGENQNVLEVYRNEELIYPNAYTFTEAGEYKIVLLSTQGMEYTENMAIYRTKLTFRIITPFTSSVEAALAPKEFEAVEVRHDGVLIKQPLEPLQDGYYEYLWRAKADSSVSYQTSFTLDTQAPELLFSKDITQKTVRPPLAMEATEEGCTLTVTHGAEQAVWDTWELTEHGAYRLTVTDRAGNAQTYRVTLGLPAGNYFTYLFIILAAVLAGAGLWFGYLRKHMRVL